MHRRITVILVIFLTFSRAAAAYDPGDTYFITADIANFGAGGNLTSGGKGLGKIYFSPLSFFFENTDYNTGLEYEALKAYHIGNTSSAYVLNLNLYWNLLYYSQARDDEMYGIIGPFVSLNYLDTFHLTSFGKDAVISGGLRFYMGGKVLGKTPFLFRFINYEMGFRYRPGVQEFKDRSLVYFSVSTDIIAVLAALGFLMQ